MELWDRFPVQLKTRSFGIKTILGLLVDKESLFVAKLTQSNSFSKYECLSDGSLLVNCYLSVEMGTSWFIRREKRTEPINVVVIQQQQFDLMYSSGYINVLSSFQSRIYLRKVWTYGFVSRSRGSLLRFSRKKNPDRKRRLQNRQVSSQSLKFYYCKSWKLVLR